MEARLRPYRKKDSMTTTERTSVTNADSALTRSILEEAFQPNVFSAWSDGYSAGLRDLDAYTHRAYHRGRKDADHERSITWLVLCGACLMAGILIGIITAA